MPQEYKKETHTPIIKRGRINPRESSKPMLREHRFLVRAHRVWHLRTLPQLGDHIVAIRRHTGAAGNLIETPITANEFYKP